MTWRMAPLQEDRLRLLADFRAAIEKTTRLRSGFGDKYFDALSEEISKAGEAQPFDSPNHVLFQGYMQRRKIIEDLESSFAAIEKLSSRNLTVEIKKLSGSHDDVISTVFQFLVLGRFADAGLLTEYEPAAAPGSTKRLEARVQLAGHDAFVEVQSKFQEKRLPESPEDNDAIVRKMHGKIAGKCKGQLKDAVLPTVLFQDTDFGVWDHHVSAVTQRVESDADCRTVSAVGFGWTYTDEKFRFWKNPNAKYRLPADAFEALQKLFGSSSGCMSVVSTIISPRA